MKSLTAFSITFAAAIFIAGAIPLVIAQNETNTGQQLSDRKLKDVILEGVLACKKDAPDGDKEALRACLKGKIVTFLKEKSQQKHAAASLSAPHQKYGIKEGTLFEDFENQDDWVVQGDGLTKAADTTFVKSGKQSLKLSLAPAFPNQAITKTINADLAQAKTMTLWIYSPSTANFGDTWLSIYLTSAADFSKYFTYSLTSQLHKGWNEIIIPQSGWTNSGAESWTNPMVKFQFRLYGDSTNTNTVYLDNITIGSYSRPKILLTFDDGWKSPFDVGYSYLKKKNLKATYYINGKSIGWPEYMSESDLKTLYDAGNDLSNHTYSHTNLVMLKTQAQMEAEIKNGKTYLDKLGFTRASDHFAYPNGAYDSTVLAAIAAQKVKTARTVIDRVQANELDERYMITRQVISGTTTLAAAKAYVDKLIEGGGSNWFSFHKLVASPTESTECGIADFYALMDYIAEKRDKGLLDVVTVSEWYDGM